MTIPRLSSSTLDRCPGSIPERGTGGRLRRSPPAGAIARLPRLHVGLTLATPAQVDALFDDLRSKGVRILKEPQAVFWGGYSGYFADPDGNAWEVAHNPFWSVSPYGLRRAPSRAPANPRA